jgi:hypothetical protein
MELWQANPFGFLFEIPQMNKNTYAKDITYAIQLDARFMC